MNEHAATPEFLLKRMIDVHHGLRINAFIIDTRHDTDDAPRLDADIDELHDRVGPHEMPIDRVLARKQLFRDVLADDHYTFRALSITIGEIAPGQNGNSERSKVTRRDRSNPCARIVFRFVSRPAFD